MCPGVKSTGLCFEQRKEMSQCLAEGSPPPLPPQPTLPRHGNKPRKSTALTPTVLAVNPLRTWALGEDGG